MKDLLSHDTTKNELSDYISRNILKSGVFQGKTLIVAWQNTCYSNQTGYLEELASTQEEADTKMISHAVYISKNYKSDVPLLLTICSPDTDVFILILKYYDIFNCQVIFNTGTGPKERKILISAIAEKLTKLQRDALPALHALSGCDTTGGFSKKGDTNPISRSSHLCLPDFFF